MCPGAGSILPRGSVLCQSQLLRGTSRTLYVAPASWSARDPSPLLVLTAQPVALPGTAGSCRGWSGRMPAPSLLIVHLPSQTEVAPRPVPAAQSSGQSTPSRHRVQEQRPVPLSLDSTPDPPLLPGCSASPTATASAARLALGGGWSRSDNAEGGGRREEEQREAQTERESGREEWRETDCREEKRLTD